MLWVLIRIASASTHNIGFYEDLTKNIFELSSNTSSNTHLISSAVFLMSTVLAEELTEISFNYHLTPTFIRLCQLSREIYGQMLLVLIRIS